MHVQIRLHTLAALLAALMTVSTVAASWQWQNPQPTGVSLRDIVATDGGDAWAVGGDGTILRRADSDWLVEHSPTGAELRGVAISRDSTVWAVGDSGTVLVRQVDGSWGSRSVGVQVRFNSVAFADAMVGWIAGSGVILGTTDGGRSWRPQFTTAGTDVAAIDVFDATTAVAVAWAGGAPHGESLVLRTDDGGTTWYDQAFGPRYRFTGIWADRGAERVWICGNAQTDRAIPPLVIHSPDRGVHWRKHELPAAGKLTDIEVSDGVVVAVGVSDTRNSWVLGSTDDGETWLTRQLSTAVRLMAATELDGAMIAVGESGLIAGPGNLIDRGLKVSRRDHLRAVAFVNPQSGCAVGEDGILMTTDDGGASWAAPRRTFATHLSNVAWTSRNVAYAVAEGGLMIRTLDKGATWHMHQSGTDADLLAISSLGDDVFAGGSGGTIVYSRDRGNTWTTPDSPTSALIVDLDVTEGATATILDAEGKVWRTSDGGESWNALRVAGDGRATALATPDASTVIVARTGATPDSPGSLAISSDSGRRWSEVETPVPARQISFASRAAGAIVAGGMIYVTTDGGTTWREAANVGSATLADVDYTRGIVHAVGERAVIIQAE